jgi:hypothetical protein
MLPELAFALEASRLTPRPGSLDRSESNGFEWRIEDDAERYLRDFAFRVVGTGQVALALPPTGTGSAFLTRGDVVPLPIPCPSSAEMISNLQAAFRLSITELSAVLRVERPTVYSWMSEAGKLHERNYQRLAALDSLAAYWNRISAEPLGARCRTPFVEDKKSVLDLLACEELPTRDITRRLRQLAREHVPGPATSVRSRLNRTRNVRAARGGDPELLT